MSITICKTQIKFPDINVIVKNKSRDYFCRINDIERKHGDK